MCLYELEMGKSKKIFTTVANCILSRKVRNFNDMVVGRNNAKLQKFSS